ncbi:MAG: hypothetical protein NTV86_04485 [Planctomycetota bacterium]|nr:hypothetical protein [Planctomycetota bacterium]
MSDDPKSTDPSQASDPVIDPSKKPRFVEGTTLATVIGTVLLAVLATFAVGGPNTKAMGFGGFVAEIFLWFVGVLAAGLPGIGLGYILGDKRRARWIRIAYVVVIGVAYMALCRVDVHRSGDDSDLAYPLLKSEGGFSVAVLLAYAYVTVAAGQILQRWVRRDRS